jgi:flagellar protein FliO/FliZ
VKVFRTSLGWMLALGLAVSPLHGGAQESPPAEAPAAAPISPEKAAAPAAPDSGDKSRAPGRAAAGTPATAREPSDGKVGAPGAAPPKAEKTNTPSAVGTTLAGDRPDLSGSPPVPPPAPKEPAARQDRPLWDSNAPESPEQQESFGLALVKLVLMLGLVLALVYLVLNRGLRKVMGIQGLPIGRSTLVKVIERVPLEPRVSMYVVKAANEYLLVGRTEQGLALLSKLSAEDVERLQQERPKPQLSPFLQKLLARRGSNEGAP